jgi:hypothetical protein
MEDFTMARSNGAKATRQATADALQRQLQGDLFELAPVLGKTFIERLDPPNPELHPLRIGTQTWSRRKIGKELGITNVVAAGKLTKAADDIGAKNVKDFYEKSTPYSFASTPGIGETTIYVAFELFRSQGLDPMAWYHKGEQEAIVTFHSLKAREQKAEKRTQDDAKRRKNKERTAQHKQNLREMGR